MIKLVSTVMGLASAFNPMPSNALAEPDMPKVVMTGSEYVQIMEHAPYEVSEIMAIEENSPVFFGVDNIFAGTEKGYQSYVTRENKRIERENAGDSDMNERYDMTRDDIRRGINEDGTINLGGKKDRQRERTQKINERITPVPYVRDGKNLRTPRNTRNNKINERNSNKPEKRGNFEGNWGKSFGRNYEHMYKGNTYQERKAELDNRFEHMFRLKEEISGESREQIKKQAEYQALNRIYQKHLTRLVAGWVDESFSQEENRINNYSHQNNLVTNPINQGSRFDDTQGQQPDYNHSRSNIQNERTGEKIIDSKIRGDIRLPDEKFRESYVTRGQDRDLAESR